MAGARARALYRPPPNPATSEWADRYRVLPPEGSSESGRWRTDRAPYQRGIMDARQEPGIWMVVLVCSAQVGKTEMILNMVGRNIHLDPGPSLLALPTIHLAEEFSRERLGPMLRDTPVLAEIVRPRSRDTTNTLLKKTYPAGYLALVGANSPTGLAGRSVRDFYGDELDRWPLAVGRDGDPLAQTLKRMTTFWNRFAIIVSTPTLTKTSRILKLWDTSDQRRYMVACPHCGHRQHFEWEHIVYPGKGESGAEPIKAAYLCGGCSTVFGQDHKSTLLAGGIWQATEPSPQAAGVAGFHLNELYSPWRLWSDVAADFEIARRDQLQLQVWTNTSLGLGWDGEDSESLEWEALAERAQGSGYERPEVPDGVLLLSAGVDVQGDRVEVSVWGWGENEQGWLLAHEKIYGEPTGNAVWCELDDYLGQTFGGLRIKTTFVDAGNWTREVYGQVRKRKTRGWHAIMGRAGERPLIGNPSVQDVNRRGEKLKRGVRLRLLGVDLAKATLYSRAKVGKASDSKQINFPSDMDWSYFEGFASEIRVLKHRGGVAYYRWEKLPGVYRNEPLDCAVYAYCAAVMAGLERANWKKLELERRPIEAERPPDESPDQQIQPRSQRSAGRNWATDI